MCEPPNFANAGKANNQFSKGRQFNCVPMQIGD